MIKKTLEKVQRARFLCDNGYTYQKIADIFGIDRGTAFNWCDSEYQTKERARSRRRKQKSITLNS